MKQASGFPPGAATLFGAAGGRSLRLRCDYRAHPGCSDVLEPRLRWVLASGGRAVKRATAIIGADNQAQVFLNGKEIVANAGVGMPAVADASAALQPGENVIVVRASHSRPGTPAGLIGVLRVDFASGDPLVI